MSDSIRNCSDCLWRPDDEIEHEAFACLHPLPVSVHMVCSSPIRREEDKFFVMGGSHREMDEIVIDCPAWERKMSK